MSLEDVKRVLERASQDPDFANRVLTNPDEALTEFNLTEQEYQALVSQDDASQDETLFSLLRGEKDEIDIRNTQITINGFTVTQSIVGPCLIQPHLREINLSRVVEPLSVDIPEVNNRLRAIADSSGRERYEKILDFLSYLFPDPGAGNPGP